MYISALRRAKETLSEFSSVPILVTDELASLSHLVNHDPRGIPYTESFKSRTTASQLRLSDTRADYA